MTKFDSESARAAVNKRWEKHREQERLDGLLGLSEDALESWLDTVPPAVRPTVRRLAQSKQTSDARELREWVKLYPPGSHDVDARSVRIELRRRVYALATWTADHPGRWVAWQEWAIQCSEEEASAPPEPGATGVI